jgi:2Fe-2S ferredoxin
MPKVTFIKDGKETTVEFEQGKLPFDGHGLPESFLDLAMNKGMPSSTPAAAAAPAPPAT